MFTKPKQFRFKKKNKCLHYFIQILVDEFVGRHLF